MPADSCRVAVHLTHPDVECWNFRSYHRERLERAVPGAAVMVCGSTASFLRALERAQVALAWRFEQSWFSGAPRLRWIATPAAGRDYFEVTPPAPVRITYGSFHGQLMGETVVAMLLAQSRGVVAAARLQDRVAWPRRQLSEIMRPLRGTHVVIIGFGRIGGWIGRLLKPFGVRITGVRRRCGDVPAWFGDGDRVTTVGDLDDVLNTADHVVLCLPATASTERLLDDRRLGLLPAGATVCNVGRGNAIAEDALAAGLRSGRISAACLDVFSEEPLPAASPLRHCPNVLLMPHASAIAPNYLDLFLDEVIDAWPRILSSAD